MAQTVFFRKIKYVNRISTDYRCPECKYSDRILADNNNNKTYYVEPYNSGI